ncbi:MAG: hypothetical protein JWO60_1457 [Frankiales bacterium]|nr:hypothetical protein [Frankiales bacterium]
MSEQAPEPQSQQVVIVGQDGQPVGTVDVPEADGTEERSPAELVEQPAKVMRIGSMVKQLLEEVRAAPLDDAARTRLKDIHASSVQELSDGLAPELREELQRLSLPFSADEVPSDAELRIAQAQLVGWLEGLFHGIQTALFAQQMAAKMAAERSGRALPSGAAPTMPVPSGPGGTGQYL